MAAPFPPVQGLLQGVKTGTACRLDDNGFHVQHGRPRLHPRHGGPDGRKTVGPIVPVAGEELDLFSIKEAEQAVAVELDFMEPLITRRRGFDERRQLDGTEPLYQIVHLSSRILKSKKI